MRDQGNFTDAVLHGAELEKRCDYTPAVSAFLTPGEQAELWSLVHFPHRLFFWGGFPGAERRCAVFLPEWAAEDAPYGGGIRHDSPAREEYLSSLITGEDAPFPEVFESVPLLSVEGSGHRELRHKDILGSVMGLGITRQSVGDVCMLSPYKAVLPVSEKLCDYITGELSKVGSDGVRVSVLPDAENFRFERAFEEMSVTVASMRLDGIVSALTGMSRTKASQIIVAGLVRLSDIACEDVARDVPEGSVVTVRGFGKFLVDSTDGTSKKGRIRLKIKKYV